MTPTSTLRSFLVFMLAGLLACGGGDGGAGDAAAGDASTPPADAAGGDATPRDGGAGVCVPIESPDVTAGVHVSPEGTAGGEGTMASPIDLATALSAAGPVAPGDTVWLAGGTYAGIFTSELEGTEAFPIVVRPLPGARATLDSNVGDEGGAGLTVNGEWTIFHGLEVLSTDADRVSEEDSSGPTDVTLRGGITVFGPNIQIVNCVVHDTAQGFSVWRPAIDAEIYGNIIYNNGWTAPGRAHGHAIYTQNTTGTKVLEDNIIFFGFGTGIHAYTEGGEIRGFDVRHNVWFQTGSSDPRSSQRKDGCLIGGFQPVARLTMSENVSWSRHRGTRLGYGGDIENVDATLTDNYLVETFWLRGRWESLTMSGNSIYGGLEGIDPADYPGNDFQPDEPTMGTRVFVHANRHDAQRARVAVFNYDQGPTVEVDLSSVLVAGETFTVHSAYDVWGEPVLEGTYDGGAVAMPMGTVAPPQPNGLADGVGDDDDPEREFGAFIVTHSGCQ